ncbi:hypothetical protein Tco_1276500, partial [Tanacetum coccineum]
FQQQSDAFEALFGDENNQVVNTIAGDQEDLDAKDKQENQDDLNIQYQTKWESNLHTSDKVEVVPTSMVATYDEHVESGDGEHDDAMESGDILILNSWAGQGSPRSLQLRGMLIKIMPKNIINIFHIFTF